jgi:actin-related protein 9
MEFLTDCFKLIAPGSELTLAQLGLPEPYSPAKVRIATRMFPAEKAGEYEPHRIRKITKSSTSNTTPTTIPGASGQPLKEDVVMKDAGASAPREGTAEGAEKAETEPAQEVLYEEDVMSDEGAVYPIRDGRIVNRNAFFALLQHVYNLLSPPLHTPILMVAEPGWTQTDREEITRFVFENFSIPGFAYVDAAFATSWGFGVLNGLVIDVGKTKTDVTAIVGSVPQKIGRGIALSGCGGDAMTDRLLELLGPKGFTREMCEQLKRSDIAEILPPGTPLPGAAATAHQSNTRPGEPAGPNFASTEGTSEGNGGDEGVLDVAAIVSGDTSEYLANMEKDKSTGKKVDPKQPNAQKERASFQFEEFVEMENDAQAGGSKRYKRNVREITVGVERFLAATPRQNAGPLLSNGILDDIASQVQYAINSCPNDKRNELWSNLMIVGAGSRVRGKFPQFEFFFIDPS